MTTMTAVIFDTHSFIKKLTAVGMPEKQAEVLADEQAHLLETQIATKRDLQELQIATTRDFQELQVATKRDFEEFRVITKQDIEKLELKIKANMADLKSELIRWVLSVAGVQVACMAALMSAFKFL